jgi:hypothetical protein
MGLQEEIEHSRSNIHTENTVMSIGELISMYRDREIDLHPEFRGHIRWSDTQKSRFIESLLLGIPTPSIIVSQRRDIGVWEVIDGMQRLSAVFEFAGVLRDEQDQPIPSLTLQGASSLPSLNGLSWNEFPSKHRLLFKRARLDVKIILGSKDPAERIGLFLLLNTGGTPMSTQEIRNAVVSMVSVDFHSR